MDTYRYYQQRFPDNRESGENAIKQSQLVLLRMFKIFDHLAQKHDIHYWLDHGTLLGAVRHQGFIPWDCDFDIAITRHNYQKFCQKAVQELPKDIFFQTIKTDPFYPKIAIEAKLRDKYSSYIEWAEKHPLNKNHNGLQIDISIYDNLISAPMAKLYNSQWLHSLRHSLNRIFKTPLFLLNPNQLPSSDFALTPEDIFPLRSLPFEDTVAPCPNNYSDYLSFLYGDYQTPPPPEQQISPEGETCAFTPCDHSDILHWNERS